MSGYALIHRKLLGHPAFRNDAEAMAFAWLVVRASWRPVRVRYKGRPVSLERGQLAVSVRDFADAMDRDKGWIERLLKRLKSETMIETVSETGVLVITVCNYEIYQGETPQGETPSKTVRKTRARQTQDTEQYIEPDKEKKDDIPNGILSENDVSDPALPIDEIGSEERVEPAEPEPSELKPQHVIDEWNRVAEAKGLPRVKSLTETRMRHLKARIRGHPLSEWMDAFDAIERNPWMHGENDRGWRADFDFLLQPKSFQKLIEGSYDRA